MGHSIYTEKVDKVALTPTQDVRFVLPDRINTLSIGHFANQESGAYLKNCVRKIEEEEGEVLE